MPAALYPQVPDVPGVPMLLRLATSQLPLPVLATADYLGLQQILGSQQWGIFTQGGAPVLTVDTILAVSLQRDFDVPDFPIEQGGFASYNKVARPYDAKVSFAVGANQAARSDALATLDALVADTNLYSVVTPDRVYTSANVVHYDYDRTRRSGVSLLTAHVWIKEIRQVAVATFSTLRSQNVAAAQSVGGVQTAPLSRQQSASVSANGVH